jgi:hypothetical protein
VAARNCGITQAGRVTVGERERRGGGEPRCRRASRAFAAWIESPGSILAALLRSFLPPFPAWPSSLASTRGLLTFTRATPPRQPLRPTAHAASSWAYLPRALPYRPSRFGANILRGRRRLHARRPQLLRGCTGDNAAKYIEAPAD